MGCVKRVVIWIGDRRARCEFGRKRNRWRQQRLKLAGRWRMTTDGVVRIQGYWRCVGSGRLPFMLLGARVLVGRRRVVVVMVPFTT